MKHPAIYMMTNKNNKTLYTGVTSDLAKRVYEHKSKPVKSFTQRYNCSKLIYFEICDNMESAILREKQIKAGPRHKKEKMINALNPEWRDLYEDII